MRSKQQPVALIPFSNGAFSDIQEHWQLRKNQEEKEKEEEKKVNMPSLYRPESRSDPFDASMRNLQNAKASPRWHPPRPWRGEDESRLIRRFVYHWLTCRDRNKPSGRSWARQLGISHTWLQKLVREFREHREEAQREMGRKGDPTLAQLNRAREYTRRMREREELRH